MGQTGHQGILWKPGRTLAVAFNPHANGMNLLRLMLASSVILWHGISLGGYNEPTSLRFFSELGVDGFFALSGFLVVRSWCRRSSVWRFCWHRFLRIMPGFWICLAVTAVVGTVVAAGTGRDMAEFFADPHSPMRYVFHNFTLDIDFYDIAGTPANVPYPGFWNTPLWTLWFEARCYAAVALIGLIGARWKRLNRWAVLPLMVAPMLYGTLQVLLGEDIGFGTRFASMFAAGALLYLFAEFIPVSWPLLVTAAVVTIPLLFMLPDYQPIAAVPLAYLAVAGATVFRSPRLLDRHDLSYGVYIYGYIVQQILALLGIHTAGYVVFVGAALVLTAPVAALSWLLVERPALRLKNVPLPNPFMGRRQRRPRVDQMSAGRVPVNVATMAQLSRLAALRRLRLERGRQGPSWGGR